MKSASSSLIALLENSNQFVMVETYTFTLASGQVLVFTSGDQPNGFAVSANQPVASIT